MRMYAKSKIHHFGIGQNPSFLFTHFERFWKRAFFHKKLLTNHLFRHIFIFKSTLKWRLMLLNSHMCAGLSERVGLIFEVEKRGLRPKWERGESLWGKKRKSPKMCKILAKIRRKCGKMQKYAFLAIFILFRQYFCTFFKENAHFLKVFAEKSWNFGWDGWAKVSGWHPTHPTPQGSENQPPQAKLLYTVTPPRKTFWGTKSSISTKSLGNLAFLHKNWQKQRFLPLFVRQNS